MPTLTLQHDYSDGAALDHAGHSENMYNAPDHQGLLSCANGGLELPEGSGAVSTDNMTEALKREHFMLSEVAYFEKFVWEAPVTIYDDTCGGDVNDNAAPSMLGIRFRVPARMEVLNIDYSFFLSASRAIKVTRDQSATDDEHKWAEDTALDAYVAVYWQGVEQTGMRIPLPKSLFLGVNTVGGSLLSANSRNHVTSYEHLTAQQYSDGLLLTNVQEGTKELQFRVRLENPAGGFESTASRRLGLVDLTEAFSLRVHQRSTFGCGSVTVVGKRLGNSQIPPS